MNSTNMNIMSVESLFERLGNPGKFQLILLCCMGGNMLLVLSNHVAMVFYAAKTLHHCKLGSEQSVAHWIPLTKRNNEERWDSCHLYNNNRTTIVPCPHGWKYYLNDGETTIISEFDLVCENGYKSDLATTVYFIGVMLGSILFGYPTDKYGRKRVQMFLLFTCGIISLLIAFTANNYILFTTLRFLLGLTMQGIANASFILAMEMFSIKYRSFCGMGLTLLADVGTIVFGIVAYLLRNWRHIQIVFSILPFSQFIIIMWFSTESLRWLLLHQKFDEAETVIKRVVTVNNLSFPYAIFDQIKGLSKPVKFARDEGEGRASIVDLFRTRVFRNRTLILISLWFTAAASHYALVFNISSLFGNKYFNFCISGLGDVVVFFIALRALNRFGRRKPLALAFFLTSISTGIALAMKLIESDDQSIKIISTISALFGKTCAVVSVNVLFTFTSELYPTNVRSISLGVNLSWGRFGGVIAPQIFLLALYTSDAVPYSIIAISSMLCGGLVFLLPETNNTALLDISLEHTKRTKEVVELSVGKDDLSKLLCSNQTIVYETNV